MDEPMAVGLNADAMRDLLVLAVQENEAARRLDLGKTDAPVYIDRIGPRLEPDRTDGATTVKGLLPNQE